VTGAVKPLVLTEDEREFLTETRAIQTDQNGVEVFVGLTRPESEEYLALVTSEDRSKDRSEREDELYAWHEPRRCQIIAAEAEARQTAVRH
jgi:hypothetical protein